MAGAEIKPVYVLCGSDAFLRDAYRQSIVARIIGQADPQTAVTHFDPTAELAEVLDELRTMPFLAPRRAVLISDADAFVSAYRQQLEKYLESPSSASSLILLVTAWPKTTRLAKLVAQVGECTECTAPDAGKLAEWVRKACGKRGKQIAPDAAELLIEWRGADLAALDGELEKLSLYIGERPSITADDVGTLVVSTAGPAAFALTNAMTRGDTAGALKALAASLTRRGEEFKTLGMIAWHLRKALCVAQLVEAGTPASQACRTARVFYVQEEFLAMLKRRRRSGIEGDFRRMLAADLAMKSGAEAPAALQELVIGLCN